jgi:branched-chain amino acid transport system permease protein
MLQHLLITGLVLGAFYALIAVGYTVIYGTVRLLNFAHGDMYMLGAFVGLTAIIALPGLAIPQIAIPFAILATLLVIGFLGFLVRFVLERVDSKNDAFSPIIAAVGISLILQNSALHIWGTKPLAFPIQMTHDLSKPLITLAVCLIMILAVDLWVSRSRFGMAMRAVGIDHNAVRLMGIRVDVTLYITFAVFSAIAGVTGLLAGTYYGSIQFSMGFLLGIKGFTAAVLGGIGNVRGALLGGFLLGIIEAFGGGYFGTNWTDVISFSCLILVLTLKPTGILGETVVERM